MTFLLWKHIAQDLVYISLINIDFMFFSFLLEWHFSEGRNCVLYVFEVPQWLWAALGSPLENKLQESRKLCCLFTTLFPPRMCSIRVDCEGEKKGFLVNDYCLRKALPYRTYKKDLEIIDYLVWKRKAWDGLNNWILTLTY